MLDENFGVRGQGPGGVEAVAIGDMPGVLAFASGTDSGPDAIDASGANGAGVFANGATGVIARAIGDTGSTALVLEAASKSAITLMRGLDSSGNSVASLDASGNLTLAGTVTQNGSPSFRTSGGDGTQRLAFGARVAAPTIEYVGEAHLQSGVAFVALDRALAASIDMRAPYFVFLTPEGDSRNLYLGARSPTGFVVRESGGGRSDATFDYRIVAKPADSTAERLPAAAAMGRFPLHRFRFSRDEAALRSVLPVFRTSH